MPPPPIPPLPTTIPALRRLIASARTEEQRAAIANSIRHDYPGYASTLPNKKQRKGRPASTASMQRFELRMLEFVRHPIITTDAAMGPQISETQRLALHDLARLRTPAAAQHFRSMLCSRHPAIRLAGAKHLAWIGNPAHWPTVRTLLRSENHFIACAAAWGCFYAHTCRHASIKFTHSVLKELATVVAGERPLHESRSADFLLMNAVFFMRHIGRSEAVQLLTSTRCMHPRNPALRHILLQLAPMPPVGPIPPRHPQLTPRRLWTVYDDLRNERPLSRLRKHQQELLLIILERTAQFDPARTRTEALAIRAAIRKQPATQWLTATDLTAIIRRCNNPSQ